MNCVADSLHLKSFVSVTELTVWMMTSASSHMKTALVPGTDIEIIGSRSCLTGIVHRHLEVIRMSSRGALAENGHVTDTEYETIRWVEDAEVLVGTGNNHGLPDFAHSPNSKYIKENPDGSFRELRDYDETGFPVLEIGYHPEPSLNNGSRSQKVLHYHLFGNDLSRSKARRITEDIHEKYSKYLKRYGL